VSVLGFGVVYLDLRVLHVGELRVVDWLLLARATTA
jgi:hypothetical protein